MPDDQPSKPIEQNTAEHIEPIKATNPSPSPNIPNTHPAQPITNETMESQIFDIQDRVKRGEWWMIGLTAAIALFALCSIGVGLLQWNVMKGQLKEMHDGGTDTHALAQAAQKSADLAHIQAEASAAATCAPIVNTTHDLPDMYFVISCEKGAVYSTVKGGQVSAEVIDTATNNPIGKRKDFQIPMETVRPTGISKEIAFSVTQFSRQKFDALKEGLRVQGSFDYENGFGRNIHEVFCTVFIPYRNQAGGLYIGNAQVSCDRLSDELRQYRQADEEINSNKKPN